MKCDGWNLILGEVEDIPNALFLSETCLSFHTGTLRWNYVISGSSSLSSHDPTATFNNWWYHCSYPLSALMTSSAVASED